MLLLSNRLNLGLKMDRILLFIPMYNCANQIVKVLSSLDENVQKYLTEIIVVNNLSTDNGEEVVLDFINSNPTLPIHLLRNHENYGLGGSHKTAFDYAIKNNFDYIIVLHGDNQGHIEDLVPYLENKDYKICDCLLGARFMKGSKLEGYSLFRTFGNIVYNFLFSIATFKPIYDLGSGLNMYSTKIFKNKFYEKYYDNLMFNYCMILGSFYYKHKTKFFPIRWSEDDQVSNVKLVSQAYKVLALLFTFVINRKMFLNNDYRTNKNYTYQAEVIK